MSLRKTMVLLTMLLMAAWLVSCADVPSTGPDLPDLTAQYRFLNAAQDLGSVGITVDGSSIGTLGYKEMSNYQQFPAGARTVVLSTGDTLALSFSTKWYGTIIILPKYAAFRDYFKLNLRRYFDPETYEPEEFTFSVEGNDTTVTLDRSGLRFVHAGLDTVDVTVERSEPAIPNSDPVFASEGGVTIDTQFGVRMPTGTYTITVKKAGEDTVLLSQQITAANKRYTAILLGSSATTLELMVLEN